MKASPQSCGRSIRVGDAVSERGSALRGIILSRGLYEGEWLVRLPEGGAVVCLEENLECVAGPGGPRMPIAGVTVAGATAKQRVGS